tara:strand:- start:7174 stop:10272 length:3099 start_codon:yes stop_codon:yes gene_type:complete
MAKTSIDTTETVAQLNNLVKQFLVIQKESKATANSFVSLQNSLNSVGANSNQSTASFKALQTQLRNTKKSQKSFVTQTRNLKQQTALLTAENKKLELQLKKTKKSSGGLLKSMKALIGAFGIISGIQVFANIIKDVFNLTKTFDGLNFALERVSGSAFAAAESQRFLKSLTEDFGVELVATTERWIKFLAAAKQSGITLKDTEQIFGTMAKVSGVLGLKTDELTGIYLALEQMLSKGKVTTEELRRQLGERLPGAMGIMASSMNVTISELDKMMKKGEVLSAEVLPGFARAVERAYSLDNVENIQTLVAEQNRLTTAWQEFIRNLTEGDSIIKSVFGLLIKLTRTTIEAWNKLLLTDEQEIAQRVQKYSKKWVKDTEEYHSKLVGMEQKDIDKHKRLRQQRDDALNEINRATNKKETDKANQNYNEALSSLKEFEDRRDALIKETAKKKIKKARDDYEFDRDNYDKFIKLKEEYDEKVASSAGAFDEFGMPLESVKVSDIFEGQNFLNKEIKSVKDMDDILKQLRTNIVVSTTEWSYFKKQVEEGNVDTFQDFGDGTSKLKEFGEVVNNERLKQIIIGNKQRIDSEKEAIEVRQSLLKDNLDYEATIIENDTKAKIKKVKELNSAKYVAVVEGVTFEEWQKKEIQKINDQANTSLLVKQEQYFDDIQKIVASHTDYLKKELEENRIASMTEYYGKLEGLRKKFNGNELKDAEKELKFELDTELLEKQIAVLEKLIVVFKYLGVNVDALSLKLAKAKAELAGLSKGGEDVEKSFEDIFKEITDMASQFADAIGEMIDNQFARRIENINAEIEAESDKYDELIRLAEDDEAQQDVLRRNKEAKIKKLEKERLKEEQKQAKARKAFAVADIAINTARAIVGIWADFPKQDFGATAAIMTGVISALGALQIATVLSQPIPKYKDGGDIHKDHVGMINDGGRQEYIERNGEILSTNKTNAIVPLKTGDTIYKSYDDMVNNSKILNGVLSSVGIAQTSVFDETVIERAIERGFKKSKINNVINFHNNDGGYKQKMSNW